MSWRDREWAKFNDAERDAFMGGSQSRPGLGSVARGRRSGTALLIAVAISAVAVVAGTKYVHLDLSSNAQRSPRGVAAPPSAGVVLVRWRTGDLAPAPSAGRICVTTPRIGRVCASYVVGERPADNLTREIERRGLRVQSSG